MAICQETREPVQPYKIVPCRGGYAVSLVAHNYYPAWKLQLSIKFSASFVPTFLNTRTETTSKGKLLDRYIRDNKI